MIKYIGTEERFVDKSGFADMMKAADAQLSHLRLPNVAGFTEVFDRSLKGKPDLYTVALTGDDLLVELRGMQREARVPKMASITMKGVNSNGCEDSFPGRTRILFYADFTDDRIQYLVQSEAGTPATMRPSIRETTLTIERFTPYKNHADQGLDKRALVAVTADPNISRVMVTNLDRARYNMAFGEGKDTRNNVVLV
ncbi:MAG: hypothetical protein HYS81_05320 [Candidatus Aenigmatarchaeota archaeon]|nr:MAG: hypothetical protein HYS81_05320 [Candidatus Aenigmarchaeota archaeon]